MWDATYSLWLVCQLFLIISQVKELHNLTFVGCKRATLAANHSLLLKNDRREQHLFDMLLNLRNRGEMFICSISTSVLSYVPFHRGIPATARELVPVSQLDRWQIRDILRRTDKSASFSRFSWIEQRKWSCCHWSAALTAMRNSSFCLQFFKCYYQEAPSLV